MADYFQKRDDENGVEVVTFFNRVTQVEKVEVGGIPYKVIKGGEVIFENKELKKLTPEQKRWFDEF